MAANIKNKSNRSLFNKVASAICGVALLASSGFMYARSAVAEGGVFPAKDVAAKSAKIAYDNDLYMSGCDVFRGEAYSVQIPRDAVECYVLSKVGSPSMAAVILPDSDYVYGYDVYAYRDYKSAGERNSKASDGWVLVAGDVWPGSVLSMPSSSYGVELKGFDYNGDPVEFGSGSDMGIVFNSNGYFLGEFGWAGYDGYYYYDNADYDDDDSGCFINTATRPEGYVGQTLVNYLKSVFHLKK